MQVMLFFGVAGGIIATVVGFFFIRRSLNKYGLQKGNASAVSLVFLLIMVSSLVVNFNIYNNSPLIAMFSVLKDVGVYIMIPLVTRIFTDTAEQIKEKKNIREHNTPEDNTNKNLLVNKETAPINSLEIKSSGSTILINGIDKKYTHIDITDSQVTININK